jgi:hypothetical protein
LLRARLERQGWRPAGVVEANNLEEAELRYFASNAKPAPADMPSPPGWATSSTPPTEKSAETSPIGIFGQ